MSITVRLVMVELITYLTMHIKPKVYSHNLCVSPEPILFMMFNIKSKSIAFPKHSTNGDIRIIIAFYAESYHLSHQLGHTNAFTWPCDLYYLSKHFHVLISK